MICLHPRLGPFMGAARCSVSLMAVTPDNVPAIIAAKLEVLVAGSYCFRVRIIVEAGLAFSGSPNQSTLTITAVQHWIAWRPLGISTSME